jgi:short-subunit dehydrogenase
MACKAFLPALQKAKQGKIINMSSDMASIAGECMSFGPAKFVLHSVRWLICR